MSLSIALDYTVAGDDGDFMILHKPTEGIPVNGRNRW